MESAVRSSRIEPAIITPGSTRLFLPPKAHNIPDRQTVLPSKPCCGERNFWMQRREAEIGLRDHKCHQRPKERNDTGENPHRNGLFGAGPKICGSEGLDGGDGRDRTANPPPSHRTGL